jgi:predicted metal-binding protein
MNENVKTELKKYKSRSGRTIFYERYKAQVPVSAFSFSTANKDFCRDCDMYTKNLACPPYSPCFPDYIGGAEEALVVCIRIPSDYCEHPLMEERFSICYQEARGLLVKELLRYRKQGYAIAGAGACTACKRCAALKNSGECRKPEERIYSLESLGVNVVALARRCFDIDLQWSSESHIADFISTIGAVFPAKGKKRFEMEQD